jgi:hypothetical protein
LLDLGEECRREYVGAGGRILRGADPVERAESGRDSDTSAYERGRSDGCY